MKKAKNEKKTTWDKTVDEEGRRYFTKRCSQRLYSFYFTCRHQAWSFVLQFFRGFDGEKCLHHLHLLNSLFSCSFSVLGLTLLCWRGNIRGMKGLHLISHLKHDSRQNTKSKLHCNWFPVRNETRTWLWLWARKRENTSKNCHLFIRQKQIWCWYSTQDESGIHFFLDSSWAADRTDVCCT